MTPHFLKWSFGPKTESVDGICQQTYSRNRFYLDVKTGPRYIYMYSAVCFFFIYQVYVLLGDMCSRARFTTLHAYMCDYSGICVCMYL